MFFKTHFKYIIISVVVILFVVGGIFAWQYFGTPEEGVEVPQTADERLPVVIYSQEVRTTKGPNSRTWPTVKILRKVGNTEPEILAEIGKIGEFPNSYQLSPDKKFLLINLESKLQILDLTTKELKDLFTPKRQVRSMSYSPDGKQLFIWDQQHAPRDRNISYYAHLFTISTRNDKILTQGDDKLFFGRVWRDDNRVLLKEGQFAPYYFDLTTGQIIKTPGNYEAGLLSTSGRAMAVQRERVPDACNDYSGSATSIYNVIDPVSGEILGTVGKLDNAVQVLAFSPDDTGALYVAEKPWTNREDCNKKAEVNYYKATIATGESIKIQNPSDVLRVWGGNYIGAKRAFNYDTLMWSILVNNQLLVTSEKELRIVEQFFQTTGETANWQTYRNDEFGFELKYPTSWALSESRSLSINLPDQTRNFIQINVDNGVDVDAFRPCQTGHASLVYQIGKLREGQQTFKEFVDFLIENPERGLPPTIKPELIQTTVGGRNALKIGDLDTNDNCKKGFYYVEQSPSRYMTISSIMAKESDDEFIVEQILSTFRFIGQDETIKESYIKVISPNGGEIWDVGTTNIIQWETSSDIKSVDITLWRAPYKGAFINSTGNVLHPEKLEKAVPAQQGYVNWTINDKDFLIGLLSYEFRESGEYSEYSKIEIVGYKSISEINFDEQAENFIASDMSDEVFLIF